MTATWQTSGFNHVGITTGCGSCHNGVQAPGKSANHIASSNQCEDCHMTAVWVPATFDHAQVTGSCGSCHNGQQATGKSGGHFSTTLECDTCHTTARWTPIAFTHSSPNYPGDHVGNPSCTSCHQSNAEIVNWTFAGYQPDCAGCHANDYKTGPHKKHENPDVKYSVGELRNCAGSCHVYTDSTLTTIKDRRSGRHRVSRSEW